MRNGSRVLSTRGTNLVTIEIPTLCLVHIEMPTLCLVPIEIPTICLVPIEMPTLCLVPIEMPTLCLVPIEIPTLCLIDIVLVFSMGTNCDPLVADLFLFYYERDFMLSLSDKNQTDVIEAFNSTSRSTDSNMHDPH